jgi:hypothetical protein
VAYDRASPVWGVAAHHARALEHLAPNDELRDHWLEAMSFTQVIFG